jgi:2-keto-4-pentenoate hydratase
VADSAGNPYNRGIEGITMSDIEAAAESIWQSMHRGEDAPETLRKVLTLDDAYRVQVNLLTRWHAAGKKVAGWKIGMSGAAVRKRMGLAEPFTGYLLDSGHFPSGHRFDYESLPRPIIESELCFTMARRISG